MAVNVSFFQIFVHSLCCFVIIKAANKIVWSLICTRGKLYWNEMSPNFNDRIYLIAIRKTL